MNLLSSDLCSTLFVLIVKVSLETKWWAMNFRYITDCITKEEAISMLEASLPFRAEREAKIIANGFPAYTTQV